MKRFHLSIPILTLTVAFTAAIIVTGFSACSPSPSTTSAIQNSLPLIQKNGNLSVKFSGVMTFEYSGTQVTSFSELAVEGVPIIWMERLFSGKLEEFGAGEDITDEVHGSLSADGNWIETFYYSRQILRKTTNPSGTFYRITLKNVPITGAANGSTAGPGNFIKSGADAQKYITKIEYADGPVKGGQINSTTKYVTTDWGNTGKGQVPTMKVTFALGSGNKGAIAPAKPGM